MARTATSFSTDPIPNHVDPLMSHDTYEDDLDLDEHAEDEASAQQDDELEDDHVENDQHKNTTPQDLPELPTRQVLRRKEPPSFEKRDDPPQFSALSSEENTRTDSNVEHLPTARGTPATVRRDLLRAHRGLAQAITDEDADHDKQATWKHGGHNITPYKWRQAGRPPNAKNKPKNSTSNDTNNTNHAEAGGNDDTTAQSIEEKFARLFNKTGKG
jgi:hypothetical protein